MALVAAWLTFRALPMFITVYGLILTMTVQTFLS